MIHRFLLPAVAIIIQSFTATPSIAASDFSAMTFNLRHAAVRDKNDGTYVVKDVSTGDEWDKRKSHVIKAIHSKKPDILGVQELSYAGHPIDGDPINYVRSSLSGNYEVFGGIGGSPKDIFYNREKFVVDTKNSGADYIWPDPRSGLCPGSGGAGSTRSITWATLTHLESGNTLFVVNAHLHNGSYFTSLRLKQLACIREHIRAESKGLPVVFMGDLNAKYSGPEICSLEKGFSDNQLPLYDSSGNDIESTLNRFCMDCHLGAKLDYIFLRGIEVIGKPEVVRYSYVDSSDQRPRWPSDHFPVHAELNFHKDASFVNLENSRCEAGTFSLLW